MLHSTVAKIIYLSTSYTIVLLLLLLLLWLWYIVFVTYKANVMHFFRTNGSAFVNPLYVTHFRHSSSRIYTHTHKHGITSPYIKDHGVVRVGSYTQTDVLVISTTYSVISTTNLLLLLLFVSRFYNLVEHLDRNIIGTIRISIIRLIHITHFFHQFINHIP